MLNEEYYEQGIAAHGRRHGPGVDRGLTQKKAR